MPRNLLSRITYGLLVIGGLNWGLVGFFDYNVVDTIFSTEVARILYGAVGLAALYGAYAVAKRPEKSDRS